METTYDNTLGMLHNVAVELEAKQQVLAVGATKAQATVTVVDYTQLAGAVLTIIDPDGTVHALTEGVDWTAETSNNVTADNLAAAIDALTQVSAANPAAAAITVLAATEGQLGNTIGLQTSDAVNLTISGATLSGGLYLFTGTLTPAPVLNDGGIVQAKPSFTGSTFVTEVDREDLVTSAGKYFIDYRTGRYKVWTPDGETGSITASWKVAKLKVDAMLETGDIEIGAVELKNASSDERASIEAANTARTTGTKVLAVQAIDASGAVLSTSLLATQATLAALLAKIDLKVIEEGEVTVTTAGTPVQVPANANAKAVLICNNNIDGKVIAVGLAATVDANSTPRIGRVLNADDSTLVYVSANSDEVALDATVSGSKATYQVLG